MTNKTSLNIFYQKFQNPKEGFRAVYEDDETGEREEKKVEEHEEAMAFLKKRIEEAEGYTDFYDETKADDYYDCQTTGKADKVRKEVFK